MPFLKGVGEVQTLEDCLFFVADKIVAVYMFYAMCVDALVESEPWQSLIILFSLIVVLAIIICTIVCTLFNKIKLTKRNSLIERVNEDNRLIETQINNLKNDIRILENKQIKRFIT